MIPCIGQDQFGGHSRRRTLRNTSGQRRQGRPSPFTTERRSRVLLPNKLQRASTCRKSHAKPCRCNGVPTTTKSRTEESGMWEKKRSARFTGIGVSLDLSSSRSAGLPERRVALDASRVSHGLMLHAGPGTAPTFRSAENCGFFPRGPPSGCAAVARSERVPLRTRRHRAMGT